MCIDTQVIKEEKVQIENKENHMSMGSLQEQSKKSRIASFYSNDGKSQENNEDNNKP